MRKSAFYPGLLLFMIVVTVGFDAIFLPFLLLFTIPFFLSSIEQAKGYENIWVFLVLFVEALPVNCLAVSKLIGEIDLYGWLAKFLMFIVCFIFLISFEEMIIGAITRKLFPKQKRVEF
ncbi:MAG: hypothetical protein Q4C49_03290 [Bacillota bacterium]|nr:hypothetical protein [Bacillota bacterium]